MIYEAINLYRSPPPPPYTYIIRSSYICFKIYIKTIQIYYREQLYLYQNLHKNKGNNTDILSGPSIYVSKSISKQYRYIIRTSYICIKICIKTDIDILSGPLKHLFPQYIYKNQLKFTQCDPFLSISASSGMSLNPFMPRDAVSRTANVERTARH